MPAKTIRKKRAVLWEKQHGICCYCRTPLTRMPRRHKGPLPRSAETLEHLRRKIDGGTDRNDNIALSCLDCNEGRGAMDWLSYTTYRRGELWDNAA